MPSRRQFLATAGLFAASLNVRANDAPKPLPRATSGDRIEPDWAEKLTVTVGQTDGDIRGTTEKAIQAATDMVARFGGGTVHILPGTYRFRNAVYLASNVRILGSGGDSVIMKEPSVATKISEDSDWYDQEITLADAKGFKLGDGICLRTKNTDNGSMNIAKRTLIARSGNRFKLDKALRENFWQLGNTTVSTLFPLFTGEFVSDITIENITLDGNRANNDHLDGNYAGCIWMQDCARLTFRKVEAHHNNGDGISWQICHDVLVEDCHSHDNADLGLHPGSGSQRPIIRRNRLERNNIGLFFCWGIKGGLAEDNALNENATGISIGHRDTDNLIRRNVVKGSTKVGMLFRPERGPTFAPHRNTVIDNTFIDSGNDEGIAIDVQGGTERVTIMKNVLKETRQPMKRIGLRLGALTKDIQHDANQIEGFSRDIVDLRKQ